MTVQKAHGTGNTTIYFLEEPAINIHIIIHRWRKRQAETWAEFEQLHFSEGQSLFAKFNEDRFRMQQEAVGSTALL
jgi:hypothetical protein